jgi:transposase
MTPIRDLCRLILTTSLSNRHIADTLHLSPNTVGRYRRRLADLCLMWSDVAAWDEQTFDHRLNTAGKSAFVHTFVEPDWSQVHEELQRRGVTGTLLHEEYAASLDAGVMSLTEFRRRLARYQRTRGLVMRQVRRPGECLYLDYSGVRPGLTNPVTGEYTPVELFVAVMGASRKTFACAVASQSLPDWIEANARALAFFGCVPTFLVPDNLKAAVISHKRDEGAVIHPTYAECAAHYGTLVLPTRVRRPKDKAPVELGVQIVQRWILARLRHRVFTSLASLNEAIAELLVRLNDKPMRSAGGKSRRQLFDELDRPAMKPLPEEPYTFAEWQIGVRVGQDYHVRWGEQYYSVPHTLVGMKVNVKAAAVTVSLFHRDRRVALHARRHEPGYVSTLPEHQPKAHQRYAQYDAATVFAWAETAGGAIAQFLQRHVEHHRRPALSLQAGRGLQRLSRDYGMERLQAACQRALQMHARAVSSVASILRRQLDQAPPTAPLPETPLPTHDHVRGADYYTP